MSDIATRTRILVPHWRFRFSCRRQDHVPCIVFLSASNYMGSFMVGGRGLSAAQTLTVIVLGMLVFTVSSSFVWFKLHSGRSVRQDMMDMWYLCGGKWKELAEPLNQDPGGSTKDAVEGDGLAETDSSKQRALSSGTSRGACPHTSDASFIEHFRQDQSFKTRICLLGDNLYDIYLDRLHCRLHIDHRAGGAISRAGARSVGRVSNPDLRVTASSALPRSKGRWPPSEPQSPRT